jgi:hypothetical protein
MHNAADVDPLLYFLEGAHLDSVKGYTVTANGTWHVFHMSEGITTFFVTYATKVRE